MFGTKDDGSSVTRSRIQYKFGDISNKPDDNRNLSSVDANPAIRGTEAHEPRARKYPYGLSYPSVRTTRHGADVRVFQRSRAKRDPPEISEERGLLGTSTGYGPMARKPYKIRRYAHSTPRPDPDAVKIFPRAGPKDLTTLKPVNTLGNSLHSPLSSANKRYAPRVAATGEAKKDSEPQRKKRKVDTPTRPKSEVIKIDDDDTKSNNSADISPSTQANSDKIPHSKSLHASEKRKPPPTTSEYWAVEDMIRSHSRKKKSNIRPGNARDRPEPNDEAFTRSAKEERVKLQQQQRGNAESQSQRERTGTGQVIAAVEIPTPRKDSVGEAEYPDFGNRFAQAECQYRGSDPRESPDELQGEKTVEDSWRTRTGAENQLPPSDISPTQFTKLAKKRRKSQRGSSHKKASTVAFAICLFRLDKALTGSALALVIDQANGQFFVRSSDNKQLTDRFETRRINSVLLSEDTGSDGFRLGLPQSRGSLSHSIDIRLANNEDYSSCVRILTDLSGARRVLKSKDHIDKVIERAVESAEEKRLQNAANPLESKENVLESSPEDHLPKHKRQKLSDGLQNGENRSPEPQAKALAGLDDAPQEQAHRPSNHAHPSPETNIPVPMKTYKGLGLPTRETRSQTKQQNVTVDSDEDTPDFACDLHGRPVGWKKPLVYPKTGKKKAEVHAQDLERLRPSEFLNDNLVGFYIRFLEYHLERTDPELANRMYFFNSYFFASLTNTPRGVKGINYQAVEKWTRAVDIFGYDFVVVPINESAHWYVMIICNLPSLTQEVLNDDATDTPDRIGKDNQPEESREDPVSSHGHTDGDATKSLGQNSKDQGLNQSLHELTLSDPGPTLSRPGDAYNEPPVLPEREASDKEDWPDEDENQPTPSMRKHSPELANIKEARQPITEEARGSSNSRSNKKKGRKKPRPPGRKYHPKQPIIITFDSLGCNRSPTISLLRQYLEEEAKSKKSLTINAKKVEGMSAKQIPLQPNFSDCGLYLLAYLERFIYDPDIFITKLLRKEMDQRADWPRLKSGELRSRLRQFLLDLYDEQGPKKENGTESESLIVDSKPLRILIDEVSSLDRDQESEALGKSVTSEQPQRAMTPEGGKGGVARKPELVERPTTPTRSSPRFNRQGHRENQHAGSPILGGTQDDATTELGGQDLYDQLLDASSVQAGIELEENEPYVPETPRHDNGHEADRGLMSSPSTTNSPRLRHRKQNKS